MGKKSLSGCFAVTLFLVATGCRCPSEPATKPQVTREDLRRHKIRNLEFWGELPHQPLERRLVGCPPEFIEYLNLDNIFNRWKERPQAAKVDSGFEEDVRAVLRELPEAVKSVLADRLVALCLVDDLGGSALSEHLTDAGGRIVGVALALDASVLNQPANAWATWRENTPFRPGATRFSIAAQIETPENDNRKNAVHFILLHELGHVATIGRSLVPGWEDQPAAEALARFEFLPLSWKYQNGRYVSRFDDEFPMQPLILYYRPAESTIDKLAQQVVYQQLERTNFATLYATTNFHDDFAESFATYVHMVIEKRPFVVRLFDDNQLVQEYRPCWGKERCRDKERILARFLGLTNETGSTPSTARPLSSGDRLNP